jgi:hypothetical protein
MTRRREPPERRSPAYAHGPPADKRWDTVCTDCWTHGWARWAGFGFWGGTESKCPTSLLAVLEPSEVTPHLPPREAPRGVLRGELHYAAQIILAELVLCDQYQMSEPLLRKDTDLGA